MVGDPDQGYVTTVENTAALRTFTHKPRPGNLVTTLGGVSQGDGLGGNWFWVDYSYAADDGINVIKCDDILAGRFYRLDTDSGTPATETGFGVGNSVKTFGGVTSGEATISLPTVTLTSLDVGKAIAVIGGGAAGATLVTTIASVTNIHAAVMASNAGTSVPFATVYYGANDTEAFLAALATVPAGGALRVQRGRGGGGYFINGTHATSVPMIFDRGAIFHVPVPGWTWTGEVTADVDVQILDTGSSAVADRVITAQGYASPAWFGGRGDFEELDDVVVTNGSPLVTTAQDAFYPEDLGKTFAAYVVDYTYPVNGIVTVLGVEQGIRGTIIEILSNHVVRLSANSNVTGTGLTGNYANIANRPIQRAVAVVNAAGGGMVELPGGNFALTNPPAADGNTLLIQLFSHVTFRGTGSGTVITQFAANQTFSRVIGGKGITGAIVEDLVINGNKLPMVNSAEHQHGMFFQQNEDTSETCHDLIIRNCTVRNVRGDGLYLYANPTDTTVTGVAFEFCNRTAIHAQTFDGLIVTDCIFRNCTGQGAIKGEPDGLDQFGTRAIITNNLFYQDDDHNPTVFSVLIAGSFGQPTADMVISNNVFRNIDLPVILGVDNVGVAITGNVFESCAMLLSDNFNIDYGYAGNSHVSFCGNVARNTRHLPNGFPVAVSNCTDLVVTGNVIHGSLMRNGIAAIYCQNVMFANNVVQTTASNGNIGIYIARTLGATIVNNSIEMYGSGTAIGILVDDVNTNPTKNINIGSNTLAGTFLYGINFSPPGDSTSTNWSYVPPMTGGTGVTYGTMIRDERFSGSADQSIYGFQVLTADYQAINNRKITYGAAIPTSDAMARTWAVGDVRISTAANTISGGKVLYLWLCTVAGTPGTWVPMYLST